jgi:hypothetical protein
LTTNTVSQEEEKTRQDERDGQDETLMHTMKFNGRIFTKAQEGNKGNED